MSTDKLVFILSMALGLPALGYSYGYQHGQEATQQPCPEQDGKRVAHSIKQGDALKCVYVTQREIRELELK